MSAMLRRWLRGCMRRGPGVRRGANRSPLWTFQDAAVAKIAILFLNRVMMSIPGHIAIGSWINCIGRQRAFISHLSIMVGTIPASTYVGIRDCFHQLVGKNTNSNISHMVIIG